MNKQQRGPRPWVVALTMVLSLAGMIAMNALPAMQAGEPVGQAVTAVMRDQGFWLSQVLPVAIVVVLMLLVFPGTHRRLVSNRTNGRLSWTRNRWLVTFGGSVFILGTAIPIALNLIRGTRIYGIEQLGFIGVMWLLYGWMIVRMWVQRPSPEWKEGFETGDHSRSMDERYHLVLGKSAVTTLYWTLGLVFVVGSLYDILVTRSWPVRSIAEFSIILVLWTTIMQRMNREI